MAQSSPKSFKQLKSKQNFFCLGFGVQILIKVIFLVCCIKIEQPPRLQVREFLLLLQISYVEAYTISTLQINNFAFIQVVVNILPVMYMLGEGEKETCLKVKEHWAIFVAII